MSFYTRRVCHCGPKFDMAKATKEIAPPELQYTQPSTSFVKRFESPKEIWVCDQCGGISHAVQEVKTVVRGPVPWAQPLSTDGKLNGQVILHWLVGNQKVDTIEFHSYPRRFVVQPEPLIFQCWQLLMSKVAIIKAEPEGAGDNEIQARDRDIARHQARGIAETLAILMRPFCDPIEGSSRTGADMVVSYAIKKYEDSDYQVPGLGEHLWDPTKNPDGTDHIKITDSIAATKKAKPVARPKVDNKSTRKLSAEEAAGVKDAVASGMFSKEEVAAMFKVSMSEVDAACS